MNLTDLGDHEFDGLYWHLSGFHEFYGWGHRLYSPTATHDTWYHGPGFDFDTGLNNPPATYNLDFTSEVWDDFRSTFLLGSTHTPKPDFIMIGFVLGFDLRTNLGFGYPPPSITPIEFEFTGGPIATPTLDLDDTVANNGVLVPVPSTDATYRLQGAFSRGASAYEGAGDDPMAQYLWSADELTALRWTMSATARQASTVNLGAGFTLYPYSLTPPAREVEAPAGGDVFVGGPGSADVTGVSS